MSSSPSLTSALPATSFPSLCPHLRVVEHIEHDDLHRFGRWRRAPVALSAQRPQCLLDIHRRDGVDELDDERKVYRHCRRPRAQRPHRAHGRHRVRGRPLTTSRHQMDSRPSWAMASKSLRSLHALSMTPIAVDIAVAPRRRAVVNVVAGFVNAISAVIAIGVGPGLLVVVTNASRVGGQVVLVAVVVCDLMSPSRHRLPVTKLCPVAEDLAPSSGGAGGRVDVVADEVSCYISYR
ncbi:hypothetical protein DFP72DRAFT_1070315 [Ephemerocybe angulata]|uniref:Uncharacterized protein n=1 Tax=Ephemerocybe angulata TaxID=980116 RepID=A0A8H6HSI2_9AGAR|nr:hypothetical protein DFP72DRAFT_1070315 [Tulosesus angulatus]